MHRTEQKGVRQEGVVLDVFWLCIMALKLWVSYVGLGRSGTEAALLTFFVTLSPFPFCSSIARYRTVGAHKSSAWSLQSKPALRVGPKVNRLRPLS